MNNLGNGNRESIFLIKRSKLLLWKPLIFLHERNWNYVGIKSNTQEHAMITFKSSSVLIKEIKMSWGNIFSLLRQKERKINKTASEDYVLLHIYLFYHNVARKKKDFIAHLSSALTKIYLISNSLESLHAFSQF